MHTRSLLAKTAAAVSAALVFVVSSASAQAWHYPTLQLPEISNRDFTVLVAGGGDYGTDVVGQWREGINADAMFNADVGIATPGSTTLFLAGVGGGYRFLRATAETPIDILGTAGIYGAFGTGSEIRIPFGIVAGHRFALTGGTGALALTPFVSPRLSIDFCASDCNGAGTDLKVNFDIGTGFDITSSFGLRAALTVGGVGPGASRTSFGVGATYRPNMAPRH